MSLFDDAKPEFDPEREVSPEKKQWKPEWLRSDRERHEGDEKKEKDKKDRAAELKAAAKKRGQDLEKKKEIESAQQPRETQSVEPEIAPKGEKLRKKWRHAILEKSKRLLEFFRREEPETIDGVQLAEIMVAERIIALNEYLGVTEPKTDERRETKTELDFMGLLSEKLSSPDIEVPEEIEEVHHVIVQESMDIHTLPGRLASEEMGDAIGEQERVDEDEPRKPTIESSTDTDEADTRHEAFVRYGVVVIAALRKATASRQTGGGSGGGGLGGGATAMTKQSATTQPGSGPSDPTRSSYSPIAAAVPLVTTAAVVHELTRERHGHHEAPVEIHPISKETPTATQTVHASAAVHTGSAGRPVHHELSAEPQPSSPSFTDHAAAPGISAMYSGESTDVRHEKTEAVYRPGVRFEQMETKELLELARDVAIGNGQYLKRAYELGQIDRDGLIQVLKAKKRGQDYHLRYRLASRAHRERVRAMSSPERLQQPRDDSSHHPQPILSVEPDASTAPHTPVVRPEISENSGQPADQSAEKNVKEIIDEMRAEAAREHPIPIGAILVGAGLVIATATIYFMFFR